MFTNLKKNFLVKNIPNSISLCKFIFIYYITKNLKQRNFYFFLLFFTFFLFLDFLDGFLARKLKCESQLGAILDTLGDKLFLLCILLVIFPIIQNRYAIYTIVIKELFILICGGIYLLIKKKKIKIQSNIFGKIAFVFSSLLLGLYSICYFGNINNILLQNCKIIIPKLEQVVFVLLIVSILSYVFGVIKENRLYCHIEK